MFRRRKERLREWTWKDLVLSTIKMVIDHLQINYRSTETPLQVAKTLYFVEYLIKHLEIKTLNKKL